MWRRGLVIRAASAGVKLSERIEDVVSEPPIWYFEDDDLYLVRQKMTDTRIRRAPVVDREKRPVGILSPGDIATHVDGGMSSAPGAVCAPSEPDR